jgi:drug/metabolite transporter (DMT)-like permease
MTASLKALVADRIDNASTHAVGLLLTTAGVLVLSPDSLLIRVIDADPWTIVFWRGLLMGGTVVVGITIWSARTRGSSLGVIDEFRSIGRSGLAVAVLFGTQLLLFVTAVSHTSVANTLVILATAPLFAAILSRIFLKEMVPRRVWVAVTLSLGAVIYIFVGSIGTGRLGGDIAAIGAALAFALGLTIIRGSREVSMVPAWGIGALVASGAAFWFADPLSISAADFGVLVLSGVVVLPVAFGLIAIGPRRLSAPETGLLMLLETVFGPLWVWWLLDDQPNDEALVGGAIVIGVLVLNSVLGMRTSEDSAGSG